MAPTFGQITSYNIYRAVNGTPVAPPYATVSGTPPPTSYLDKDVTCGPTYTYFVTAILARTNPPQEQESVPSNSVSLTGCAPPYTFIGFLPPLSPASDTSYSGASTLGKSVTAKWQLKDSSGNYVSNLNANTLYAVGPFSSGTCLPTQTPVVFNYAGSYPGTVTTLYSPNSGAKGNSTFRFSTNQFVFNWNTKSPFTTGCYVIELDLDSGQVERTALKLQ
jgi:hypothetical protein